MIWLPLALASSGQNLTLDAGESFVWAFSSLSFQSGNPGPPFYGSVLVDFYPTPTPFDSALVELFETSPADDILRGIEFSENSRWGTIGLCEQRNRATATVKKMKALT